MDRKHLPEEQSQGEKPLKPLLPELKLPELQLLGVPQLGSQQFAAAQLAAAQLLSQFVGQHPSLMLMQPDAEKTNDAMISAHAT